MGRREGSVGWMEKDDHDGEENIRLELYPILKRISCFHTTLAHNTGALGMHE